MLFIAFAGCNKKWPEYPEDVCNGLIDDSIIAILENAIAAPEAVPGREFTDNIWLEEKAEWRHQTTESINHFYELTKTAIKCSKNNRIDSDDFHKGLEKYMEAISTWYILPGLLGDFSAAMLTGDPETIWIRDGQMEQVPTRAHWAKLFIDAGSELRDGYKKIDVDIENDVFGFNEFPAAFIRVDALASVIYHYGKFDNSKRKEIKLTEKNLNEFEKALEQEANIWKSQYRSNYIERAMFIPEYLDEPGVDFDNFSDVLRIDLRISRVLRHMEMLCEKMNSQDPGERRSRLGVPLKRYLATIQKSQSQPNQIFITLYKGDKRRYGKGLDDLINDITVKGMLDLRVFFDSIDQIQNESDNIEDSDVQLPLTDEESTLDGNSL